MRFLLPRTTQKTPPVKVRFDALKSRSVVSQIYVLKGVVRGLPIFVLVLPVFVLAQPTDFKGVVNVIEDILDLAYPVILALTLLVFFWGLTRLLASGGDEKAVEEGKKLMLWGIVGLFVMLSMWAIVALLTGSFFNMSLGLPQSPRF